MKKALIICVLIALAGLMLAPAAAADPVKIKLAHLGKGDPLKAAAHAGAVNFGHTLNKLSAGKFEVDIYPRGTLGKEMDLLQAVRGRSGSGHYRFHGFIAPHLPPGPGGHGPLHL